MVTYKDAYERLVQGNERFSKGKSLHPNLGKEIRKKLIGTQKPFATIVACSDSRVPVEIVFDAGIGDIFVIRTAGHVLSKASMASVEYSVSQLGVNLVVVLGHDNCGAVQSAIHPMPHQPSEYLDAMVEMIRPAVEKAGAETKDEEELYKMAIKYNTINVTDILKTQSGILGDALQSDQIKIMGANYHFDSGLVTFFE